MAKFIVDKKLYDTEKSTLLCEGKRKYTEYNWIFQRDIYLSRDTELYKTQKGAFYFVYEKDYGEKCMMVCTEEEAKDFLMRKNLEKYEEMYGKLEEA